MSVAAKPTAQKVLLMGKSGSGKSSMRNIIFSNYNAKDVRRLGATIDIDHSRVKFLGNLVLNLWDCAGQGHFTDNFLTTQKQYVFSDVGLLIYVFDTESRDFPRDIATYVMIIEALASYSPHARVFVLIHKMDLVQIEFREAFFEQCEKNIRSESGRFKDSLGAFATTIWDQSLYRAWGSIVHSLIPNLNVIGEYLEELSSAIEAEEVVLFERTTFLTVMSVRSKLGERNPCVDRYERLSNIVKTFKHSLANFTGSNSTSHQFSEFYIKTPQFNLIITRLTANTFVLAVLPPGDAEMTCTRINIALARQSFASFDPPKHATLTKELSIEESDNQSPGG